MEKLGILGPTDRSSRRPGDVSFKSWAPHRGLAVDVAVICPLAASYLHEEEPCESYALLHKHARYDKSFRDSDYDFAAMVFETSGAVNEEGLAMKSRYSAMPPSALSKAIRPFVAGHGPAYHAAYKLL